MPLIIKAKCNNRFEDKNITLNYWQSDLQIPKLVLSLVRHRLWGIKLKFSFLGGCSGCFWYLVKSSNNMSVVLPTDLNVKAFGEILGEGDTRKKQLKKMWPLGSKNVIVEIKFYPESQKVRGDKTLRKPVTPGNSQREEAQLLGVFYSETVLL